MSLTVMTPFLQTDGYAPVSAMTAVEKKDGLVNAKLADETAKLDASFEQLGELIQLRDRIREEGISREVMERVAEIAPQAIPLGYGAESFTVQPSRFGLNAGMEGLARTILNGLNAIIKWFFEKVKAGMAFVMDLWNKLSGVSPSAYKLERRLGQQESILKDLEAAFGIGFIEDFDDQLKGRLGDADSVKATILGLYGDANTASKALETVAKPIAELNKEITWLTTNLSTGTVELEANLVQMADGKLAPEQLIKNLKPYIAYNRVNALGTNLRKVCDVIKNNATGLPELKNAKIIEQKLNEKSISGMIAGLLAVINEQKQVSVTAIDALNEATDQSNIDLLAGLAKVEIVDGRIVKTAAAKMDKINPNKVQIPDGFDSDEFGKFINEFTVYMSQVESIQNVIQSITRAYAEVVLKLNNIKANKNNLKLKIWKESVLDKQMNDVDNASAAACRKLKDYFNKLSSGL